MLSAPSVMRDFSDLTSLLFVPADKPRFVASAAAGTARATIIDLEDAVSPDFKTQARARLQEITNTLRQACKYVFVRVNESNIDDLEACLTLDIDGVFLPKIDGPDAVRAAALMLRPRRETLALFPMVESARGVLNAQSIASATEEVCALMFGAGDFVADTGFTLSWETLLIPASLVSLAAKAEGRLAWGLAGSIAIMDDIEALADLVRVSRSIGYTASPVIHPTQLACVDTGFGPTLPELEEAKRIVAAFEANGQGATRLGSRLLERPVYLQALSILRRGPRSV